MTLGVFVVSSRERESTVWLAFGSDEKTLWRVGERICITPAGAEYGERDAIPKCAIEYHIGFVQLKVNKNFTSFCLLSVKSYRYNHRELICVLSMHRY